MMTLCFAILTLMAPAGIVHGMEPIDIDGFRADPLRINSAAVFAAPSMRMDVRDDLTQFAYRLLQSPPPTPPELQQAQQHHQRALDYVRAGDLSKAMLEVRDGLAYTPDNPALLALAGTISMRTGQLEDAAGFCRRWLDVEPNNFQCAATYLGLLVRLSRIAEAETVLRHYAPLAPNFMAFRFYGLCLDLIAERPVSNDPFWEQRPFEDIVQLIEWLYEDQAVLARALGVSSYGRLCELTIGTRATANLQRIHTALAHLLRARASDQFSAALDATRELVDAGLRGYGIRALHADLLERSGARAEALSVWRQITADLANLPQAWVSAAHVFLRNGRTDEALAAIQRAKELLPREPVVDFLLASALALSGRTADAHPVYVQLVSRRPREFQRWLESDAVFEAALDRMPNKGAIMRRLEIPPELE